MQINTVGVISDTHNLLRPAVLESLGGCDFIIHAGDITEPPIIERLNKIAPVKAVRGNNDKSVWATKTLPEYDVIDLDGCLIYVRHILGDMDLVPESAGIQFVISGHSHKPEIIEKNGVTYLNPGSAGPRRFSLPISIAMMKKKQSGFSCEIIEFPS